jgi:uncharacterized protein
MVEEAVLKSVEHYLTSVREAGIDAECAVVFGSQTRGEAGLWSDIDVLVVAPQFDGMQDRRLVNLLWRLAARIDSRIEPVPCGSRQWREDDSNAIIEIARREGEVLVKAS